MISYHREMPPSQIVLEEFHGGHHCEQFRIGGAIPLLAGIPGFKRISNNLLANLADFLLLLLQHRSQAASLVSVDRTNDPSLVGYASTGG